MRRLLSLSLVTVQLLTLAQTVIAESWTPRELQLQQRVEYLLNKRQSLDTFRTELYRSSYLAVEQTSIALANRLDGLQYNQPKEESFTDAESYAKAVADHQEQFRYAKDQLEIAVQVLAKKIAAFHTYNTLAREINVLNQKVREMNRGVPPSSSYDAELQNLQTANEITGGRRRRSTWEALRLERLARYLLQEQNNLINR